MQKRTLRSCIKSRRQLMRRSLCRQEKKAGPQGDETEDARGYDLLHTELSHLRGPAASHSIYLKEIGQHMKIGHHM
ncbi:hypothetical protein H8959_021279 [Pygathrix nigripes]